MKVRSRACCRHQGPYLHAFVHDCKQTRDINQGRDLHFHMIHDGLNALPLIGDHLIRMFAAHNSLYEANLVFHEVEKPTVYTWHAIISAHVSLDENYVALHIYEKMQQEGVDSGKVTFLCILKACTNVSGSWQGRLVHHQIIHSGLESDVAIGSSLIDMYAKCGSLDEASTVLERTKTLNEVSFNAFTTGCIQQGQNLLAIEYFQSRMALGTLKPNSTTYCSILKACSEIPALDLGRLIHNYVLEDGLLADLIIVSSLVLMYSKCGMLDEAFHVFYHTSTPNLVSWNTLIAGCVHNDQCMLALSLYDRMQNTCLRPDSVTFSSVVKSCGIVNELTIGRYIHDQVVKFRLEDDLGVANMLLDMYARCGSLDEALKVFYAVSSKDIVSWGAIMSGYIQHGHASNALESFDKMQEFGFLPSESLILSLLKACCTVGDIEQAKLLHKYISRNNIKLDLMLGSALIDVYAKCRSLKEAYAVFLEMKERDVVVYNTLIAAYTQEGDCLNAVETFVSMQASGIEPDKTTFSSILKGYGNIGAIEQGKLIHHKLVWSHVSIDTILSNTLIDMYARCGAVEDARKILTDAADRNVGSWGAMIAGYSQHGEHQLAKASFMEMQQQGIEPDDRIFTSMLLSCSHVGQIAEGLRIFRCMKVKYGLTPSSEHYNCMIDLLAGAGRLKEAGKMLEKMPVKPDITGWMSLLAACRRYGDVVRGRWCFDQIFRQCSGIAAAYILISNIFSDANLVNDLKKMIALRNKEGVRKKPGMACIELNGKMYEFVVGDKDDALAFEKINRLKWLSIKDQGYLPRLDLVFESVSQNVDEE